MGVERIPDSPFQVGELVEYTREALDRFHMWGDDWDPNPMLWGKVLEVKPGPAGGVIIWQHQRGIEKTLGMYLCRVGSTFREKGCG